MLKNHFRHTNKLQKTITLISVFYQILETNFRKLLFIIFPGLTVIKNTKVGMREIYALEKTIPLH